MSDEPQPSASHAASVAQASSSASSSTADKNGRWRWDDQSDLVLVTVVKAEEVWACAYGQLGRAWQRVAERFYGLWKQSGDDILPSERACRDRYQALYERRKRLDQAPAARSGSSEEYGELEQLLSGCVDATEQWVQQSAEGKKKTAERRQEVEDTQKRIRVHTMQTLKQRRTSQSSSSGNSGGSGGGGGGEAQPDREQTGHAKRQKPSLKIQQEALEYQKEIGKSLAAQMEKLVAASETESKESVRSNDLFEQFLRSR